MRCRIFCSVIWRDKLHLHQLHKFSGIKTLRIFILHFLTSLSITGTGWEVTPADFDVTSASSYGDRVTDRLRTTIPVYVLLLLLCLLYLSFVYRAVYSGPRDRAVCRHLCQYRSLVCQNHEARQLVTAVCKQTRSPGKLASARS